MTEPSNAELADALERTRAHGEFALEINAELDLAAKRLRQGASYDLRALNAEGMAGCMRMFCDDMLRLGVIDKTVPPMMMTEAMLPYVRDARRYRWWRENHSDALIVLTWKFRAAAAIGPEGKTQSERCDACTDAAMAESGGG